MSPEDRIKKIIQEARNLYSEVNDSDLMLFLKRDMNLSGHTLDDLLESVPLPIEGGQSYLIKIDDSSIRQLSLKEAANYEPYVDIFNATIIPELEKRFSKLFYNPETGKREEHRVEIYRRLFLKNISVLSKRDSLTYESLKENLLKRKFELNKKGEKVYTFTHPIKAELLFPQSMSFATHIAELSHDDVEDSREHKALEKWLATEKLEPGEKEILENLGINLDKYYFTYSLREYMYSEIKSVVEKNSLEAYALERLKQRSELSEQDRDVLSKGFNDWYQRFVNYEVERYDYFVGLYNEKFDMLVNEFILDLGIAELGEEIAQQVHLNLVALSRRKTQSNYRYLRNIDTYDKAMEKMGDRIVNTKILPETKGKEVLDASAKILTDGVKNTDLSLVLNRLAAKIFPEISDLSSLDYYEYHMRQVAIVDETNTNMDRVMNVLKNNYRRINLKFDSQTQSLEKWFQTIETKLYVEMLTGGFENIDEVARQDHDLLSSKGIMARLDNYLRGDTIGVQVNEQHPEAILELYTYVATLKVMAALSLGYNPFKTIDDEEQEVESIINGKETSLDSRYRLITKSKGLKSFENPREGNLPIQNFLSSIGITGHIPETTFGKFTGKPYNVTSAE